MAVLLCLTVAISTALEEKVAAEKLGKIEDLDNVTDLDIDNVEDVDIDTRGRVKEMKKCRESIKQYRIKLKTCRGNQGTRPYIVNIDCSSAAYGSCL